MSTRKASTPAGRAPRPKLSAPSREPSALTEQTQAPTRRWPSRPYPSAHTPSAPRQQGALHPLWSAPESLRRNHICLQGDTHSAPRRFSARPAYAAMLPTPGPFPPAKEHAASGWRWLVVEGRSTPADSSHGRPPAAPRTAASGFHAGHTTPGEPGPALRRTNQIPVLRTSARTSRFLPLTARTGATPRPRGAVSRPRAVGLRWHRSPDARSQGGPGGGGHRSGRPTADQRV